MPGRGDQRQGGARGLQSQRPRGMEPKVKEEAICLLGPEAGWSQEHPTRPLGHFCWGGWACRGRVFWKPAIVSRHVRWLPGAKGPRALAVTSVWDGCAYCVPLGICLVPRPDLWPPRGPAQPAGSELLRGCPTALPTAPGGHGAQALGRH